MDGEFFAVVTNQGLGRGRPVVPSLLAASTGPVAAGVAHSRRLAMEFSGHCATVHDVTSTVSGWNAGGALGGVVLVWLRRAANSGSGVPWWVVRVDTSRVQLINGEKPVSQ